MFYFRSGLKTTMKTKYDVFTNDRLRSIERGENRICINR